MEAACVAFLYVVARQGISNTEVYSRGQREYSPVFWIFSDHTLFSFPWALHGKRIWWADAHGVKGKYHTTDD